MKSRRQARIIELINEFPIDTQEELLQKLRSNGFNVTQATVSRDIKELRLLKTLSPDGKYQIILYDVKDSDKGAVKICVVPYGQDIELKFFTLKQKGISKTISNKGTRGVVPDVGWIIDPEDGKLKVQYRMSPESDLKKTSVTVMPKKQYLDFLGIS